MVCATFPLFFTTQTQLLVFQLVPSASCGGTNQRALLATVLVGLGCETSVTAVKMFWLESSSVREGSTSFCPVLPCFPWLVFNPGSFHSPKGSHLLPKTFVLLVLSYSAGCPAYLWSIKLNLLFAMWLLTLWCFPKSATHALGHTLLTYLLV